MNRSSFLSSFVLSAFVAVGVLGCQPRGESRTLDEIFTDARSAYQSASVASVSGDVADSLKKLALSLDKLAGIGGAGDGRSVSAEVADSLSTLVQKAGIPSRPAMTELINQYRSMADASGTPPVLGAPNLKLLAARTYSLIQSELGAAAFRL
jgi:hypothetical protein